MACARRDPHGARSALGTFFGPMVVHRMHGASRTQTAGSCSVNGKMSKGGHPCTRVHRRGKVLSLNSRLGRQATVERKLTGAATARWLPGGEDGSAAVRRGGLSYGGALRLALREGMVVSRAIHDGADDGTVAWTECEGFGPSYRHASREGNAERKGMGRLGHCCRCLASSACTGGAHMHAAGRSEGSGSEHHVKGT
jgi:hypothetical protein